MPFRIHLAHAWGIALALILFGPLARAQRQMEKLGRGVVALRASTSQAYIGWRLLGTDPETVGFHLYRSANGGAPVKLNGLPLTNTTDFVDTTVNFAVSNAWHVVPVLGGVAGSASAPAGLPANAPIRQYLSVPLQPVAGGANPPYDVKFCWVGDFDGDGEFDFLVDRLSTTANVRQYLQAYRRDGTFLWQMDLGTNSTLTSGSSTTVYEPSSSAISIGDKDNVTVYDLDGDGKAEVVVRTANGVTFGNGAVQSAGASANVQFVSVIDGLTGAEITRATLPNPYIADGPLNCHAGILYADGVRPTVVFSGENRVGEGAFQRITTAFDYRDRKLVARWTYRAPAGVNDSEGHQLRVADVNHDGKDDLIRIGAVLSGDDAAVLHQSELVHGDRYHVTDIDPDRPGLEMFAIQQNNATLLATTLQDMRDGSFIKKWYDSGVVDVGRGVTLDMDPNHRGYEMYSTQPGIYDRRGNVIFANTIWPPEAIWWDADLSRELEDGAGSGALSPVINKFNPATGTASRLYTIYNENGGVHQAYGGRAAFWGDIFGDWREELVLVANDYSEIRLYTTKLPATNRLYTLMHNAAYRVQCTFKGYYQASYPDYYLGTGMAPPPPPPVSAAKLVWRGGGENVWDNGATALWRTNALWISNTIAVAFSPGDTVLFDLTGSNQTAIALSGALAPGEVRVYSPKDFTFGGDGSLVGAMSLTKAGGGRLTLSGEHAYSGPTLVAEGPLVVDGALSASPVTVRGGVWLDGRLGGSGRYGAGATIEIGGGLSPGAGGGAAGIVTVSNQLTLAGGTLNDFDLSDDPTGANRPGDLAVVEGNLVLRGTNTFVFRRLHPTLPAGTYPLLRYRGTLTGGLTNLAFQGLDGVPARLVSTPGEIALVVQSVRPPAARTWLGGLDGNAWNLVASSNWLNGASRDWFVAGDTVRFDQGGAANATVNLVGALPVAGVTVAASANYTFTGSGRISGPGGLIKTNAGKLTLLTANDYTGPTRITGGTLEVGDLSVAGAPGPLGAAPNTSPTNLVLSRATWRFPGADAYTDRGFTLAAGTGTVEVVTAGVLIHVSGQITGPGALAKTGAGTFILGSANTYSGGTVVKAGVLQLASDAANENGLGSGLVTLDGGTLAMLDASSSYSTASWNVAVPAGSTGTWLADSRADLHGTLTGGGTLNFRVPFVRTTLFGNWSAFTGRINVTTDADGGDFRVNNGFGYANAAVHLAAGVAAYRNGGGAVSIGELGGAVGSTLSGTTWTVGAKNTDAVFAGTIQGNSVTKVGSGAWALTGTNTYTGATTVSGGTLLIHGNHSAATGGVTVQSGGTLGGTGWVAGAVSLQGTLAPGPAIGKLTFLGNVTLSAGATTRLKLNRATRTNDVLRVQGTFVQAGRLVVTNLGGIFVAGDRFHCIDAASRSGAFSAWTLPALPAGLGWDTSQLASAGLLQVVSLLPPVIGEVRHADGALVWSGSNGAPLAFFHVLGSTNVAAPLSEWLPLWTNQFDSQGRFILTNPVDPFQPVRFFQLHVP